MILQVRYNSRVVGKGRRPSEVYDKIPNELFISKATTLPALVKKVPLFMMT